MACAGLSPVGVRVMVVIPAQREHRNQAVTVPSGFRRSASRSAVTVTLQDRQSHRVVMVCALARVERRAAELVRVMARLSMYRFPGRGAIVRDSHTHPSLTGRNGELCTVHGSGRAVAATIGATAPPPQPLLEF